MKKYKFANKNWKGVISERKKQRKAYFADKDLSSWSGLGKSGHVQIPISDRILHVSGPNLIV